MASEVDIANLALAHLGDTATVASIDPPENSVQAEHCARFYPMARDALLEMHDWGFATRRVSLAAYGTPPDNWAYSYARPNGALKILSVINPYATDTRTTQGYESETDNTGAQVIYTDVDDATALYIYRVTDTGRFSPLFTLALSWQLASMLAGPILKGDVGANEAKRCAQMAEAFLARARASDANQRHAPPEHSPIWISGR